jgi:penicillin-binding protein 1A
MHRLLRAIAVLIATTLVVPVAAGGSVMAALLFLPLPASMPEPLAGVTAQISHIYDINGNEIGQFRQFETTKPVTREDVDANPWLKNAVISSEDRRFRQHAGVDPIGTLRALWADLRGGGVVQGGSTITQQYVKNAYVGNDRSLSRKIREAILASQLDRQLDKDEILFQYLSNVYLGEGAHGVGAAAETYFGKSVRDLTISEAATLAGLIPAPSRYEPRGNVELAEQKRLIVLKKMFEQHFITDVQYLEAVQQKLWLGAFGPPPPGQPATIVLPRQQERTAYPYHVDYVRRYIETKYGAGAEYTMGLKIYTSLDPRMQQAAEEEVANAIAGVPDGPGDAGPLEMAMVSVEPGSGYVKALVGGKDFYADGGQVNLALGKLGGGSGRQPGSSFKPFVLAEALEQGVKPTKTYSGRSPLVIGDYKPANFANEQFGTITLKDALKHSVNTVFVQLIRDIGVQKTMDHARELGLTSVPEWNPDYGLSVALGSLDTSPLELASAYGVWAARGERAVPTPIVRILDANDVVLEDNSEPKRTRVEKEVTADTMNDILQGPLSRGGTAGGKGLKDRPSAGKTGTTQDFRDALFVGYTPNLSTAVWMGYRNHAAPLHNIKGVRSVAGGTIPASTWQRFMTRAHEGLEVVKFSEPAPITDVADNAKREARGGFDVGTRRSPIHTDDGDVESEPLPPPSVEPPPSTTTTTTTPGGGLFGNGASP